MKRDPIDECNQRLQSLMANAEVLRDSLEDAGDDAPLADAAELRLACQDIVTDVEALTAEIKGRLTEAWTLYERVSESIEQRAQEMIDKSAAERAELVKVADDPDALAEFQRRRMKQISEHDAQELRRLKLELRQHGIKVPDDTNR